MSSTSEVVQKTRCPNARDPLADDAELDRRILANRERVLTELAQEEALSAQAREKALS